MSKASDRAYRAIRDRILDGSLEPGTRLKEEELAERIGVSRTPVREALRNLLTEGMAERPAGGSAILVTAFSVSDLEDMFQLRILLESHAAGQAARRITADQLTRLQELVDGMDRLLASRTKQQAYLDLNALFHRTILEASGSRRLQMMVPHVVEVPIVSRTFHGFDQSSLERSNLHHQEITVALRAKDADWAAAVMRSHIINAWHSWRSRL